MAKLYRLRDFLNEVPISRSAAYREMAAGRLSYVQYGRTRFITEEAKVDFIRLIETEGSPVGRDDAQTATPAA